MTLPPMANGTVQEEEVERWRRGPEDGRKISLAEVLKRPATRLEVRAF